MGHKKKKKLAKIDQMFQKRDHRPSRGLEYVDPEGIIMSVDKIKANSITAKDVEISTYPASAPVGSFGVPRTVPFELSFDQWHKIFRRFTGYEVKPDPEFVSDKFLTMREFLDIVHDSAIVQKETMFVAWAHGAESHLKITIPIPVIRAIENNVPEEPWLAHEDNPFVDPNRSYEN